MRKFALALVVLIIALISAWILGPFVLREDDGMADPRSEIHAAELDGKIYVAGGIGFFRTLDSCAVFDSLERSFAECPDLPRALHHVALAAGDGRVFASGGYTSLPFNQDVDGALFALDLASPGEGWREIAKLPQPLGQHAMVFREGVLWLIGGESAGTTLASLWRYDLASGEWEEHSPMPTPRHSHAIALTDGKLIVTGGRSASLGWHSRVVEVYDFAEDKWATLPDAPFPLGGHGAAFHDGRLHVFGGEDLDTAEVFVRHVSIDPNNPQDGWREEADMPAPRHGFAVAQIGSTVWIIGGGKRAGWRTPYSVTGTALPLSLAD